MLAGGEGLAARRMGLRLLEGLHAAQPDCLTFDRIGAAEAEAAKVGPGGGGKVEPEENDIASGNGIDGETVLLRRYAHVPPFRCCAIA